MFLLAIYPECINGDSSAADFSLEVRQDENVCPTVVHENVCVQGTVTITPNVVSGESSSLCLGRPVIGGCVGRLEPSCSFTVSQSICVEIPLVFSATATAVANGMVCGTPTAGECPNGNACTHTIGYYRNHSDETNALITAAGGSITLGTGAGLSFIVTTANANRVLDLDTPAPPAPASPPFAGQYQNLYAQLLAAKLNVLRIAALGIEPCSFAVIAIAAADNFLGASPAGGMAGASAVQEPLAQYNEGDAPGCPFHCDD